MVRNIFALYPRLDIRDVLPAIQVPALVLHRRDDRMVRLKMGRYSHRSSRQRLQGTAGWSDVHGWADSSWDAMRMRMSSRP